MRFFEFEGNSLAYSVEGQGKAIVFLHGFLEDHTIWDKVVNSFPDFKSILIDLPGHGQSKFADDICSMKLMAELVDELLIELEIDNPFVFGHSMGGYVGLELIKLRDCKLTLVHSNFWADSEEKKKDRDRVIEVLDKGYHHFVREAIPGLFAKENVGRCDESIDQLVKKASEFDPQGIIAATAGMRDRMDNSDLMKANNIYIIQGSQDPIITEDQLNTHLNQLEHQPNKIVLENVGHMGMWEDTLALINSMKSIINQ